MAVRSITYKEFEINSYESVVISEMGSDDKKMFSSGNFVKDWFDALKWFIQSDLGNNLVNSSSVDHFIMDGGSELYDSAYLMFDEEKNPYLSYSSKDFDGLELFVEKDTEPTWEELKNICDESN